MEGRYGPGARKYGTRSICLAGCQMSVVMRAMENAYVINGRSRVAFIPRQDRYMFRVFHSMPREKDGLNEASIKSPFIAATGAIRLRE